MKKKNFITSHFTESEFTESPTARKYGIDNTPTPEEKANLRRLCLYTLEPLRQAVGHPLIITSGYRCKPLNDRISHHSHKSQHLKGQAADFYVGRKSLDAGIPGLFTKAKELVTKVLSPNAGQEKVPGSDSKSRDANARQRLVKAFRLILTRESIDFDQLILYPTFIHVSFVSHQANRHYIMIAQGNGRYGRVSREVALTIV